MTTKAIFQMKEKEFFITILENLFQNTQSWVVPLFTSTEMMPICDGFACFFIAKECIAVSVSSKATLICLLLHKSASFLLYSEKDL